VPREMSGRHDRLGAAAGGGGGGGGGVGVVGLLHDPAKARTNTAAGRNLFMTRTLDFIIPWPLWT
jgi:hypothetical protein